MSSYPLKYTFLAWFRDGSVYEQREDDTPKVSPVGSAFTDIKDRLEDINIFALYCQGAVAALVDLRDGHFEVNGLPITVQDPSFTLPPDTIYRLIYFRRVTHDFSPDASTVSVAYHIGWQATVDGKNHQQTIAVW